MDWFYSYLISLKELFFDLWLFMLIGFIIAAIVEEFVSKKRLLKYFGKNNFGSLIRAAAAGFVVSACSCGAIPLVASLRERGASTATLLTFLLAAPWLGIPMLMVYISFLGWLNTIALISLSISLALILGLILGRLERANIVVQGEYYRTGSISELSEELKEASSCGDSGCCDSKNEKDACNTEQPEFCSSDSCGDSCETINTSGSFIQRIGINVPKRAWVLGKDIGFYLLLGMFIAAIPKAFVSPDIVNEYLGADAGPLAVIIALPVSIVIEACSEGFAVLAGQLYEQGATLAVVFVMTMVGVASDFTELAVVWGKFGKRTTFIYFGIGTSLTLIAGLILQIVLWKF